MAKAPRGQRTLRRCIESYLDRQQIRSKPKSVRNAECSCGHLLRVLGNRSVYKLIESDLDLFILARRKKGVRDKTINGDLTLWRPQSRTSDLAQAICDHWARLRAAPHPETWVIFETRGDPPLTRTTSPEDPGGSSASALV